jgi:hypothetical protein
VRLGCCLVAGDLNREYLDFFPLVRQAWREIVGAPVLLALVADHIPADLAAYAGEILLFPPLPGVHTAFQAQCVRLLLPSLLATAGGAVLTSDIDMIPMNRGYYVDNLAPLPDDSFAILRADALKPEAREIAICYNAALPATWSAVVGGVASMDDVRRHLANWAALQPDYDGRHGGAGWNADQRLLYELVLHWPEQRRRAVCLTDQATGYRRLDRLKIEHDGGLTAADAATAAAGGFSDYHMMRPPRRYQGFNRAVATLPPQAGL